MRCGNKTRALCAAAPLLFALLCFSCASVPGFKQELKRGATVCDYLHEFFPDWKPASPGIDVLSGRLRHPKLRFYAARIDLTNPQTEVVLTPPAAVERPLATAERPPASAGRPSAIAERPSLAAGQIYSTYVSSFAKANGCRVALNAGPFAPVSAREGEPRTVVGLFVADGVLIAGPEPAYDAIVFYRDGTAAIVNQRAGMSTASLQNAAGGFGGVLRDGRVDKALFARKARHPRSAAGLDGRYLYLLAIDGRWFDTVGATEAETGLLLRALGAASGLNLDGGGSTALALRTEGRVIILNRPIHKQIPGKERAVATCIGVR